MFFSSRWFFQKTNEWIPIVFLPNSKRPYDWIVSFIFRKNSRIAKSPFEINGSLPSQWQFWWSRRYRLVTTIFTKLLVHSVHSDARQCAIWGIFARPAITQQSLENGEDRIWGQEQKVKGGTISSLSYKRVCLVKFDVN